MQNWAIEEGYLVASPIPNVKKPRRRRRDVHYTPAQYDQIIGHAKGPIVDLLSFLWWTRGHPKKARMIEVRYVHEDLIIFPADESNGQEDARIAVLVPKANEIISRKEVAGSNPVSPT